MLEDFASSLQAGLTNAALIRYGTMYEDIARGFRDQVGMFGLDWEPEPSAHADLENRIMGLTRRGAIVENDGKSIRTGWISPSCVACRKGVGTETFLASTQCTRSCYFCFNPNQADYEFYLDHVHDMAAELQQRYDARVRYTDLAVTGGEPLLHREELMAFLTRAHALCPEARVRLYTSGAGLDEEYARELAFAGLDEIRFSVKLDEPEEAIAETLALMRMCTGVFADVMVEMPVMPDQVDAMKRLLAELDSMGCSGVNLLELCFPLCNANEFSRRGYMLKARPYRVLYDYWYAGGLPIAKSEQACLELVEWAIDAGVQMGVHYCSLENKLTGQVYQQNRFIPAPHPRHEMSQRDYFLKVAKVFGDDCNVAKNVLESAGETDFAFDAEWQSLEFAASLTSLLADAAPSMPVAICSAIAEMRDGEPVLRELGLQLTTPATFDYGSDI